VSGIREQLVAARNQTPEVFPDAEPAGWRRVADAAVEGVLLFYGAEPVTVGRRGIDWSGAHLRHQEWPAQLNRFNQLAPLRWAYRRTGEERYPQAARDYIEDWLDSRDPYPPEAGGGPAAGESTLNAAVRLGGLQHAGWLGALGDLMGSAAFDEPFARRMVASIEWQLDWLAANLPGRGNWRIAALDAMFSTAPCSPRQGRQRKSRPPPSFLPPGTSSTAPGGARRTCGGPSTPGPSAAGTRTCPG